MNRPDRAMRLSHGKSPASGHAKRAPGIFIGLLLSTILSLAPNAGEALAQTVRNRADGTTNGVVLDPVNATVSLNRTLVPGASSVAEISPNGLVAGSTGAFTLDLLPTILATDPSVTDFTVTLPPAYRNPTVTGFDLGGAAQTARCPAIGPGDYCATVSGPTITVSLGQPLNLSLTPLRLHFTADAPFVRGSADFAAAIVAPGGPRASTPGDADGDPGDANSLSVTVRSEADSLRSTVTADPPIVLADGSAVSTITVTLRDLNGAPVGGKSVTLASDRGADIIVQPAIPTNAEGITTGTIASPLPGLALVTATEVTESLTLGQRARVTFTQGQALQMVKTVDRRDVVVGGLVGYSITIRNRTTTPVVQVRIEDRLPADFKYVRGTATLDGYPVADPVGDRTLTFDLGTMPALADRNGNGSADPGEPGAWVLRYQLVVGAGATPGEYRNIAVAKDVCETCVISNADEASVRVRADELFTLGTILGKVFEDQDGNGRQGKGEPGVAGAMVALDDGSYALTDGQGLYHFPAVAPGDRLTKINLATLPGPGKATTDEARIVRVTPGLLAKANFGVTIERDTAKVGSPAIPGLEIATESRRESLEVVGTTYGPRVLLNGLPLELPSGDAHLSVGGLPEVVELRGDRLSRPIVFRTGLVAGREVRSWSLTVVGAAGDTAWLAGASGSPPNTVPWDGTRMDGTSIGGGDIYQYRLNVLFEDGSRVGSAVGTFGVNRTQAISLSLTGKAFMVGSNQLSASASEALQRVAEAMRRFAREKILIEGHTDAMGPDEANLELSRLRATAAAAHLSRVEGIDSTRIVLRWFGESRPIASNDTPEGREQNRRVEVRSQFQELTEARLDDVFRATPDVRIDGAEIPIQPSGRFATRIADAGADTMRLALRDPRGQVVEKAVPLPGIEILEPAGTHRVAYGAVGSGFDVRARTVAESKPQLISLEPANQDGVAAIATLSGRTEPGNTVEVGRETVAPGKDGAFRAELPLRLGMNAFGVMVRNSTGAARIVNLLVNVTAEDDKGNLVIAVRAMPPLTVYLPARGAQLGSPRLTVTGVTDPANRVTINGQAARIGADGAFHSTVDLPKGTSHLVVEATDPEGNVSRIEREVARVPQKLFLLAIADGVIGQLQGDGFLEGAGRQGAGGLWAGGRLAYYLKGTVAGKYLITSAIDAHTQEFGKAEPEGDEADDEWLMRSLDPDRLYPVYGDSSTVVYDSQARGRFFLAVDSDELQAMVGNYPLALTDTELASFQRTLYGGRVNYRSLARTRYGDPRTAITLLGAEVRQQHLRDELSGTGGSLYYLSHKNVIEGSEQVSLAIRDRHTGLILTRIPQTRGIDYTIKYPEGRLLFTRPIASVSEAGGLVSPSVTTGDPVTIEVDYEERVEGLEQTSAGGRVQQRIGDHLAVGGTYLRDGSGGGRYDLHGADLEVKLGNGTKLIGELAGSRGVEARVFTSGDGGVSFSEITPGGILDGRAYKAAADLDVGEWFGSPRKFLLRGYLKRLESDFFATGNLQERGSEKKGLSVRADLTSRDRLTLRHDRDDPVGGGAARPRADLTSVLLEHTLRRWGLGAELQSRTGAGSGADRASVASGRFWFKPTERLTGRLEHQATLTGPTNDQTRLGIQYQVLSSLALEARGVAGKAGNSVLAGAVLSVGEGKVYVTERMDQGAADRVTATVIGAQAPLGPGSRAYSEYQWEHGTRSDRRMSVLGLQQRWEPNARLSIFASGEHGDIEAAGGNSKRTTLAGGLAVTRPSGLMGSSRGEVRFERGITDRYQWLATQRVEARLFGGLSVLGNLRHSVTKDRALDRQVARFAERSLGFAYRPGASDRLNALARYTHLADLRTAAAGDSGPAARAMDVLSAEATVDVNRRVAWSGKGALRSIHEGPALDRLVRAHSMLVIQRVDYTLLSPVGIGVEYRWLRQREARDLRHGWLNELIWKPATHLRLGTGFNFTRFSDDEFSSNNYSVRGWFVRVQGKY